MKTRLPLIATFLVRKTFKQIPILVLLVLAVLSGNTQGQMLTNLYQFSGNDGESPVAGLVQGSDGNFYGTTYEGGDTNLSHGYGDGTVFRISPSGSLTNLYSFRGSDGAFPNAGLVQGSDGNFYGTTQGGGHTNMNGGYGTVFRISPSGSFTNLYQFSGNDGSTPLAALVQGSDGNFYGTTQLGGHTNVNGGYGTVFRISPSGSFTNLYQFSGNDGANPNAGLVQGSDGNFYGTTYSGGSTNVNGGYADGTVFRISSAGTLTTLYQFGSRTDGVWPGGLVQGSDGNFYGTTYFGGTNGDGTVFRISPSGSFTNLYQFSGDDGANPYAALVQGSDGNFYGTTWEGGYDFPVGNGYGTVFRVNSSGSFTSLYQFSGGDGGLPLAGLVQGSDGYFYGTTEVGGTNNVDIGGDGTVFQLSVPLNPPANQIAGIESFSVFGDNYAALSIPSVAGETYQLQYTDSMNPTNWINSGDPITSIGGPLTTFDLVEPMTPQRFYRFAITP